MTYFLRIVALVELRTAFVRWRFSLSKIAANCRLKCVIPRELC